MYKVFFLIFILVVGTKAFALDDLATALKNPSEVKQLDLSNQKLPEKLDWSVFSSLETLNLKNCQLDHLDSSITSLKTLRELVLDGNVFEDLNKAFDRITQLKQLRKLSLNHCFLLFIPNSISKLENLTSLSLANNKIFSLPRSFHDLISIQHLDLEDNNLDTLSYSFIRLAKLESINLSHNPYLEKERAYSIFNRLTSLKSLTLKGLDTIGSNLLSIPKLEYLDLSEGVFYTLPEGWDNMKSLKKLKVLSNQLIWDKAIEKILFAPTLKSLVMGGCGFKNMPFNLLKLKRLKKLEIQNSVIGRIPSRISSLKLTSIKVSNCYVKDITSLSRTFTNIKSLKSIEFNSTDFSSGDFIVGRSNKWEGANFYSCNLTDLLFENPDVSWTAKVIDCSGVKSIRGVPNIVLKEKSTSKHQLREKYDFDSQFNQLKPRIYTVYGEVGLVVDLTNNILLDIPEQAFEFNDGSKVSGEVELLVYAESDPIQQLSYGVEYQLALQDKRYFGVSPNLSIVVEAYQDGERLQMSKEQRLKIEWFGTDENSKLYSYNQDEGLLELNTAKAIDTVSCFDNLVSTEMKKIYDYCKNEKPIRTTNIRQSQVYLKVKKGRRNKPFHFYLEPEYGFNEKYIPLLGNKVKAYSEFKAYKGVRWNYKGSEQQEDYEKLYNLTDVKPEKLRKKSSLYLYVLDLADISLYPSAQGDFYEFKMYRGFDTLNLEVLPGLSLTSANKIQKWHKKKFTKYLNLLEDRKGKWSRLDSLDSRYEYNYYERLNQFRLELIHLNKTRISSPNLDKYIFGIGLNEVFVIGQEISEEFTYQDIVDFPELKKLKIISISAVSSNGKIVQTAGSRFPELSLKMKLIFHIKGAGRKEFLYEDGIITEDILKE